MSFAPEILPVLSRGKHRHPRKGACFMEFASYLAGEKWSDQPGCTHPLLGEVARSVNDRVSDDVRPQLAVLVPEVIGLTSDDPRVDARIALHCALVALPVAPVERQRALAVAVISCRRVLDYIGDDIPYELRVRTQRTLEQAPHATAWARRFAARTAGPRNAAAIRRFRRAAAYDIVRLAARGIEQGAGDDADARLREMLVGSIEVCRVHAPGRAMAAVDPGRWRSACELTT